MAQIPESIIEHPEVAFHGRRHLANAWASLRSFVPRHNASDDNPSKPPDDPPKREFGNPDQAKGSLKSTFYSWYQQS
jgi:hypothetical protein